MDIFYVIMDAEVLVLKLIKIYLEECKKKAFTYNSLRYYYYKNKVWEKLGVKYDWHTIERTIRKLCEKGVLHRKKIAKNKVIFFLNENKVNEYAFYKVLGLLKPISLPDGRVMVNVFGYTKIFSSIEELHEYIRKNIKQFLS